MQKNLIFTTSVCNTGVLPEISDATFILRHPPPTKLLKEDCPTMKHILVLTLVIQIKYDCHDYFEYIKNIVLSEEIN